MNYINIKTKDWRTKKEISRERKKGLVKSLLKVALLTALSIPISWYAINGGNNYLKAKDQKYLEKNRCVLVNKSVTKEDARDQYIGVARRIIRGGEKITLGKYLGINRLTRHISEENENKILKKDEFFKTYECKGCE